MKGGLLRRQTREAWPLLLPMLLLVAAVAAWPLLRTAWLSLTNESLADPAASRYIGFGNYDALLADRNWWGAVRNTALFTVISVSIETVLGLVIALLIDAKMPGRGLVRAFILIPWALPTVVSARIWQWMLHDQYGVVNAILINLGLIDQGVAWTASPATALAAVIVADVWQTTPFMTLLILAGLQLLPREIYEAARVDGVPATTRFFRVTLPLIAPAISVAVLFRMLDAVRMFDLAYVLTANGRDTQTVSIYAREQLVDFQDVGYGSAVAMLIFLGIALLTVAYVTLFRVRIVTDDGDAR